MTDKEKMSSRELGLVLARQLLDVEDLHYGLWDDDLEVSLSNFGSAQQRYTDMLLEHIGRLVAGSETPYLLEVGCGTGRMLQLLLERGYRVDGVNPSAALNEEVRQRLLEYPPTRARLLEMHFEAIPDERCRAQYDLVLFSESFQYIPLPALIDKLPRLLHNGGHAVICDFFKTDAHGDASAGDRSFGGGHVLSECYRQLQTTPLGIVHDEDLTARVSPTIALLDDWLTQRLVPATATLNTFLLDCYPRSTRLIKWLWRRKLQRARYKYLSGHRSQAVFEKFKTYRLIILQKSSA